MFVGILFCFAPEGLAGARGFSVSAAAEVAFCEMVVTGSCLLLLLPEVHVVYHLKLNALASAFPAH